MLLKGRLHRGTTVGHGFVLNVRECKTSGGSGRRPIAPLCLLSGPRLVKIRTSDRIVVPVLERHDPGMDLHSYMRLPVSQYVLIEVPLGGALSRISEDVFEVVVAPVRFFDLWVQPRVRCRVRLLDEPHRVDIRCVECIITGSPLVEGLRLTERVDFDVHTTFTPIIHTSGAPGIQSVSVLTALVDPPAPFSYLPDSLLEGTGNAVVHAALKTLQDVFIRSLAQDYGRWATDAAYREQRTLFAVQSDERIRQMQGVASGTS